MKYLKNITAVLVLIGIFNISYSAELSVGEIKVLDENTLSVTLSENPNLEIWEIDGEVKVLNDVELAGVFVSETDSKAIEIILDQALMPETTYSLLTVLGSDGSIDFTTPTTVDGFTSSNMSSVEQQDIDVIQIIDERTLMVYYREEITASSLEYKLLAESKVVKIEKPDFYSSEILLLIDNPFISEKDYILMFIEMQDASGEFLEFDTGIYDFTTPDMNELQSFENDIVTETVQTELIEIPEIEEIIIPDVIPDLQAGAEVSLEKSEDEMYVNQAAAIVTQTPETGAQTWVLIIITIVINSFYYLSRRNKQITAV